MKRIVGAAVLCILVLAPSVAFAAPYTVLTYNLGLLRVAGIDLVPLVEARSTAAPRVLASLATETNPEIMLLEEVWEDTAAYAIAQELSPLGYVAIRPTAHSFIGLSSGLLLLVKQPLHVVDWRFTPFTRTSLTDSFASKGVLEATLEDADTGVRIALVGTHTIAIDTHDGIPTDPSQIDVIREQVAQILAALDARSEHAALPSVLLGDFNVGPGYVDSIYSLLSGSAGMREAGAAIIPGDPLVTWDRTNPLVKFGHYPNEPSAKIDQIFLRSGASYGWSVLSTKVVGQAAVPGISLHPSTESGPISSPLSDHYGFLATVVMR
jgi:hypothetical protein